MNFRVSFLILAKKASWNFDWDNTESVDELGNIGISTILSLLIREQGVQDFRHQGSLI